MYSLSAEVISESSFITVSGAVLYAQFWPCSKSNFHLQFFGIDLLQWQWPLWWTLCPWAHMCLIAVSSETSLTWPARAMFARPEETQLMSHFRQEIRMAHLASNLFTPVCSKCSCPSGGCQACLVAGSVAPCLWAFLLLFWPLLKFYFSDVHVLQEHIWVAECFKSALFSDIAVEHLWFSIFVNRVDCTSFSNIIVASPQQLWYIFIDMCPLCKHQRNLLKYLFSF